MFSYSVGVDKPQMNCRSNMDVNVNAWFLATRWVCLVYPREINSGASCSLFCEVSSKIGRQGAASSNQYN